jgi:hypothetical protein
MESALFEGEVDKNSAVALFVDVVDVTDIRRSEGGPRMARHVKWDQCDQWTKFA